MSEELQFPQVDSCFAICMWGFLKMSDWPEEDKGRNEQNIKYVIIKLLKYFKI